MLINEAPAKFLVPFCDVGGKNAISLDAPTLPQNASLEDGFPPITRTPINVGGIPPSGLDLNGIFFLSTAVARWQNAGASYVYDAAFANDVNVGGYPAGAKVLSTDFKGYWINSVDSNITDPEAGGLGWAPGESVGSSTVVMSSSDLTLTYLEAAKEIIYITGTLTSNLNLIFPDYQKKWTVANNCIGNFTITCKTLAGTGVNFPVNVSKEVTGDGVNISPAIIPVPETKSFVNRLANGAMKINQMAESIYQTVAGTSVFTLDMLIANYSTTAKFDVRQVDRTVESFSVSDKSIRCTSLSAYSPAGVEIYTLTAAIEGLSCADFLWGTPEAQNATLSFYVKSSITGTFGGSISNLSTNTAAYPFEYTVAVANVEQRVVVRVPGPTSGVWDVSVSKMVDISFSVGAGVSARAIAGAWGFSPANTIVSTIGAQDHIATNGATLTITGVQFERRDEASEFAQNSIDQDLLNCQRYFEKTFPQATAPDQNTGILDSKAVFIAQANGKQNIYSWSFQSPKRVTPSVITFSPNQLDANWSLAAGVSPVASIFTISSGHVGIFADTPLDNGTGFSIHSTADARL